MEIFYGILILAGLAGAFYAGKQYERWAAKGKTALKNTVGKLYWGRGSENG